MMQKRLKQLFQSAFLFYVSIYSQNYTLNLHPSVTLFFAVIHRPSVYFITLASPMFQSFHISPYESKLSTAFSFNPEPLPKPFG